MSRVLIAGAGMTPFGKTPGRGIRHLSVAAIDQALTAAEIPVQHITKVFFANAAAGAISHQEMIRGQVALRHHALANVAIINIENACASGGSAVHLAFEAIAGDRADVALVVGVEQMSHAERERPFHALRGSTDIDEIGEGGVGASASNSVLMDFYAEVARQFMARTGATAADFARVAVKNRKHAAANPMAYLRSAQTVEEVLAARMIVAPLTLPMCSPITDGAAALVLCSERYQRQRSRATVEIVTSQIAPGTGKGSSPVRAAARAAYEAAAMGVEDLQLFELHDAAAPAELIQYEEIGLCAEGEAHHLLNSGETALGGAKPVNTSGGLLSRGHPLGATGCAQLVELWQQLQGKCGERQVGNARAAMAINGGGWLDGTYAVAVATILRSFS